MPDVILTVNGQRYGGWTEVEIRRGIEQVSGTFELTVTERWAGQDQMWPIRQGEECTLTVDGAVLISGYVDEILPFFDDQEHSVTVVGRDKTGDLVDCSAIAKTGEWKGRTLLQVARDIAAPFGIKVTAEVPVGAPFKTAALQEGESAFEALERAARMRGVLLISDAQGDLVITRAGRERVGTALVQGQNILSGRATFSLRDRFSTYICKGQDLGSDWSTPEQNAQPKAEAKDAGVSRYRPLLIVAEDVADAKGLKDRALWEAAVRLGRSARPAITVQGWSHEGGLWLPNRLVPVDCPYLYLAREMLIVAVSYRLGDQGTTAEIELCRPEAFELLPVPEPASEESLWN
ncbi:phage baseplate assembly protein [Pseudomonas sp.]|uniref:phage baseplate assembly protein n=1 Tax=Pseudomonas sp. TaxID=306 RepID=UPI003D0C2CBA